MTYIFITALGMIVGAWFAITVVGKLKENAFLLPMAIMIAWDGIWIAMMYGYTDKKQLAFGIMFGTIFKVMYLIKTKL